MTLSRALAMLADPESDDGSVRMAAWFVLTEDAATAADRALAQSALETLR